MVLIRVILTVTLIEQVGAVLLKRTEDAELDGDTVWALIRGYGISNDGAVKAGYSAPAAAGQRLAIIAAMEMANVYAEDVSYVECHATATNIGDAIELRGLTARSPQPRSRLS